MTKIIKSKDIEDLLVIEKDFFKDHRGEYVETYNADTYNFTSWLGKNINFVEDDISKSKKGVLRGLHGDQKTWKLVQCLHGSILLVVVDVRKDSRTYLKHQKFLINDRNKTQVLVPPGCGNGHYCISESCIFSYKQSEIYSGANNQFTLRWNDPCFMIDWPDKDPIISERDKEAKDYKK